MNQENINQENTSEALNIRSEEFRTVPYPDGVREQLYDYALSVIKKVEEKAGKQEWLIRYFHPKSEEDIKIEIKLLKSNGEVTKEDYKDLDEKGLSISGWGMPEEEREKAWNYLLEKKYGERIRNFKNGYIDLCLKAKQLTICSDGSMSNKSGKLDGDGAVDYLIEV